MIKVTSLVKNYGKNTAVKGIDFEIAPGEIFGLLGPNGAGKTSTIAILACLHQPTAGTVRIKGLDVRQQGKLVKPLVGMVPQELALYTTLTAHDNLVFFGQIYGLRGKQLQQRIGEVLDVVGLRDRAREVVDTFSGGMKRRLNLACGLLHFPEVLLLDEPTVGVDPQSRNLIFENIRYLNRERHMTVIYTTHYMEEAEALCQRVAVMDQGKIIANDTPRELINRYGNGVIVITAGGVTPGLQDRLRSLPLVCDVAWSGRTLRIGSNQTNSTVVEVLELLRQEGIALEALQIKQASLENVFLKLTGKSLRDSGESPEQLAEAEVRS